VQKTLKLEILAIMVDHNFKIRNFVQKFKPLANFKIFKSEIEIFTNNLTIEIFVVILFLNFDSIFKKNVLQNRIS